jgi:serine/threonine protein kinase
MDPLQGDEGLVWRMGDPYARSMLPEDAREEMTGAADWGVLDVGVGASLVGRTVGKYEVLEEIGRGGMGVVYRARQRGLERLVALKALHGASGLQREAASALLKESRLAGSLSHPNIVTVYEYLEEDDTPYIAMELVSRGSLRNWMGCMSVAQLAGVLEDLLAGLAAVAPSGIVHRDLKPENVMVTADGRVKIADFGIAKATQRMSTLRITSAPTGVAVGTPAYMAPEQALCEDVGPWTDLYSIGIMTYEHLVGRVPFGDAPSPMAMLLSHVKDPVIPPADVDGTIDPRLSDWVTRLLVKDSAERTRSASDAWDELEEIVIGRLGPMWRREARLVERPRMRIAPRKLDAVYFTSQRITIQDPTTELNGIAVRAPKVDATLERAPVAPEPIALPKRRSLAPVALAAAAVLAAAGGFAIAHGGSSTAAAREPRASSGTVQVSLPPGWTRSKIAPTIRGYDIKAPLALRSPGGAGTLRLGLSSAASGALLPRGIVAGGQPVPSRETVDLDGRAFFRYSQFVMSDGSGSAVVYAAPTSAGVLVGVCGQPPGGGNAVSIGCEQILSTVSLGSAGTQKLSTAASYATTLNGQLAGFDRERSRLDASLARATTARGQAEAASSLSGLAAHTSREVRDVALDGPEQASNKAIAGSLDELSTAYKDLAGAAQSENAKQYADAANAVNAATSALARAVAGFTSA